MVASITPSPLFLSTPSARRATGTDGRIGMYVEISIHALREEGDAKACGRQRLFDISIHALREEGDGCPVCVLLRTAQFLSTPSARRATRRRESSRATKGDFYPRPPRGGRRDRLRQSTNQTDFYPRPPRGGRPAWGSGFFCCRRFLSTPSARRATPDGIQYNAETGISIHALREEGDVALSCLRTRPLYFYPRPPRGGRPFLLTYCATYA